MKIFVLGSVVQAMCWKVDTLPQAGETRAATALAVEVGGKGINVAIGTKRLGADSYTLLGIGHDATGEEFMRLLEKEGISSEHTWKLAPQSGYGAGMIAADGENAIAVYPGPNLLLTAEHARQAQAEIKESDLVYAQFETSLPAITEAFRIAREQAVRTVLNPSPWQNIPSALLDMTDVLIVNEVEAGELLSPLPPLRGSLPECETALRSSLEGFWRNWQGSLLVVTLGATGSIAFERDGRSSPVAGYQVDAIDTVGAGDAFASSFCVELCKRTQLTQALRHANAAGAIVASRFGVLDALPTAEVLQSFLTARA